MGMVGQLTPRRGRITPGKYPHCIGGWVGPRAGLDGCENSHAPPGFDPGIVQPVESRCADDGLPV